MTARDAGYFDGWYADLAGASARDDLFRRHLGLPPDFTSTSMLTFEGVREIRDVLGLTAGDVLLDLGCGRGGYGLWLAAETGADAVGVDFSAVAIGLASAAAATRGLDGRAEFRVGTLQASGLPDDAVDAVLCVDAVQFADEPAAAAAEICRVLRPGGLAVLTCWEPTDRGDERLPERLRRLDLAEQLRAGGLVDVTVVERATWLDAERSLWQEAVALDPGGDRALESVRQEGERVLPTVDLIRRVLATAAAPDPVP